jgi:hypothetical protein
VDTELEFDFAAFLYARQAARAAGGAGAPEGR